MNHKPGNNQPKPFNRKERDTGRRYSLSNSDIGSVDRIVPHPSGDVRVIEYSSPNKLRINIRDRMMDRGLIIGTLIDDTDDVEGVQSFRIPSSARPIAYEASQRASGEYTYDDDKLFYDLGVLFGSLAKVDEKDVYVVRGGVGMLVAVVDFTQEGECPLGFVPGVETAVYPLHTLRDALDHYDYQLTAELGEIYVQAKDSFISGYRETISES